MAARQLLCTLALLISPPAALAAQSPSASILFAPRPQGPLRASLTTADTLRPMSIGTYAKEGAIAGGVAGAVAGGLLAEVACGLSEEPGKTCTGSFLIGGVLGAAMGALPGALIGGLFPKYPKGTRVVGSPAGYPQETAD